MLSCRMSQQPPAQPGPAPAPSPPAKGSGHAAAAPAAGRERTRSPDHGHGSHVAAPCPSPPELQTGAAARIRPHPRGRLGWAIGGVPGAGPCQAHASSEMRGERPAASWQRLRGEFERPEAGGEKGGVPPAARTPRSPPPTRRKGLLVAGGSGRAREGPWGDSVPHRGAGVGAEPAGAARDTRARVPLGKCVTRTRERFAHPSPSSLALGLWWGN